MDEIPEKFYKYYGTMDYAVKAIKYREIYFSEPHNFNDYFDCSWKATVDDLKNIKIEDRGSFTILCKFKGLEEIKEDFLKEKSKECETVFELLQKIKGEYTYVDVSALEKCILSLVSKRDIIQDDSCRIACFTPDKNSLFMWGYYCNSFKGVCLEFDRAKDEKFFSELQKVNYADKVTRDTAKSTKSTIWDRENEWRIINYDGKEFIRTTSIVGVYIGCEVDINNKLKVISEAKYNNIPTYIVKPFINKIGLQDVLVKEL